MTSTAPDLATFRRSTGELPESNSLSYRREIGGLTILRLEAEASPYQQLQSTRSVGRLLPSLVIVWGAVGDHRLPRTIEHVAEGDENMQMPLTVVDSRVTSQCSQEAALSDGKAIVTPCSDLAWVTFLARSQCVSVGLPRKALIPLIPHFQNVLRSPIPQDNEALRLLKSYVNALGETPVPATSELQRLIVAHIQDLVALMIGATRRAAAISQGCSVRHARLRAIKADIVAHLRQQEFTLGAVAARQGVSARYVQMLFEREGTTFSHFVLGQRLALAHRMLTDRRYDGWTIYAIAMEAGFGDLSYFNHAFRRLYAASPSEARTAAANQRNQDVGASD
jgi:AraC-like DNA-binding protein